MTYSDLEAVKTFPKKFILFTHFKVSQIKQIYNLKSLKLVLFSAKTMDLQLIACD